MSSRNINLRDPAIYRIRFAEHHRTGDKWCIYPMYTFAHPLEDVLENITHSICTLEFEDQRAFYNWATERSVPITRAPLLKKQKPSWQTSRKRASKKSSLLPKLLSNSNGNSARPKQKENSLLS